MEKATAESYTVGVVADDATVRRTIRKAIQREIPELAVQTATSGDGVIERVKSEEIDAVLCATRLTDRSPVEVVRRLRAIRDDLPIVLLTTDDSDHETVAAAIDAGVTDVFPPVETPEEAQLVAERIRNAVSRADQVPQTGEATRDVTDREELREKLQTRERRLQLIAEHIDEVIYLGSIDLSEVYYVSPAYEDIFGRPVDELYEDATQALDYVHPDDREEYISTLKGMQADIAAGEARDRYELTFRIRRPDGAVRWLEVTGYPILTDDGRADLVGVAKDVTERKERERIVQTLHSATERLQEATTAEEVGEIAVTAARDVLDLPMTACWLCQESRDEQVLEPVAATQPVSEFTPEPFEPGDVEYEAFREGELLRLDSSEHAPPNPLDAAILLPLGDHGLLGAGKSEVDEYPEYVVDAGRTLAGHVTTALDRVAHAHELRESERRFRLIAERIDEIIYLATSDFSEILYINPAYEDLYGQPVENLVERPRSFVEAAHPDDREQYEQDIERMIEDIEAGTPQDAYEGEYRLRRDGATRWVHVSRYPVRNEDGPVDRVVGIVEDITERRELEQTYREIFESVSDGLVVHDSETGEILDVNDRYCELTGYTKNELVGEDVGLISAPGDEYTYEGAKALIHRARTEGPQLFEWRNQHKNGETYPVEVHLSVVELRGEERVLASVRDITERKRRERELRETEEQFHLVTENIDELIFLSRGIVGYSDAYDGDPPDVAPLYMSPAYEDIYGRPVEEIYEDPSTLQEAVHPDDEEAYFGTLDRMVEDARRGDPQDVYEMSFRIQRPDGEVRWLEGKIYPITPADGEPYRWVGISRDITDQKRREETLETFHEATRDLTEATSREAASRTAVEAATDVLGFPLVGVYLFDETASALQPVAVSERLEAPASLPSFGPGENLPWQVFVDGEVMETQSADTSVFAAGTPDPDLLLPLGSHGVMLVGTLDDGMDAETVDFAQILAATVESALNHVEGKREIEQQEEELRAQQVRADRLDRLNTVIREIEQVTVEKAGTEEIVQAVCDRLTDVELYQVAWIGDPSGADGPEIHASAGDRAYVESLDTAGDLRGRHPAVEAYEEGEVRAVQRIAADTPHEAWEKRALRRGYQAVVAVPLGYEDTIHGVLSVVADDPTAFDEEEQTILSELGRSIGYELTVLERERALESDTTTELEFHIADGGLLVVEVSDGATCRIELDQTVRRADGTYSLFCTVEGTAPADAAGVATQAPTVVDVEIVSGDTDEETGLLEVKAADWFGSLFTRHGAVLRESWAEGGTGRLVVEVPGTVAISDLVETFQEQYPNTDLLAKRDRQRAVRTLLELQDALEERLTDRQLEVLKTAYSAGYFEWPRAASSEEIAALLGITQPTFNKHLRTAERRAFAMLLERDVPD